MNKSLNNKKKTNQSIEQTNERENKNNIKTRNWIADIVATKNGIRTIQACKKHNLTQLGNTGPFQQSLRIKTSELRDRKLGFENEEETETFPQIQFMKQRNNIQETQTFFTADMKIDRIQRTRKKYLHVNKIELQFNGRNEDKVYEHKNH